MLLLLLLPSRCRHFGRAGGKSASLAAAAAAAVVGAEEVGEEIKVKVIAGGRLYLIMRARPEESWASQPCARLSTMSLISGCIRRRPSQKMHMHA